MKKNIDISIRWRNGGKRRCRYNEIQKWVERTSRPYLAHLCSVQRGVVVVFLLSASDNVVIGTKLPATLSPILGHLLLCCEKQHPCSLFKRYSFVCLFNATSNLIQDHRKLETIISSCQADSMTCRKNYFEGIAVSSQLRCCCIFPIPHDTCCTYWSREDPLLTVCKQR